MSIWSDIGNALAPAVNVATLGVVDPTQGPIKGPLGSGALFPSSNSSAAPATAAGIPLLSMTPGYAAAQSQALATGPSQWANLSTSLQQQQADNAIDAGVNSAAGDTAAADAALASTGGLSSGARERVQEGGDKDLMSMAQGVDQTLATNIGGISQQDLTNRMNQLANFNQLNSQNVANQDAAVAAAQTSNAIASTPTKGI